MSSRVETVSAGRVLAALLAAERLGGAPLVARVVEASGLTKAALQDETEPVPSARWLAALEVLVEAAGPAALAVAADCGLQRECLGRWGLVLRGADSPEWALSQLALGGERWTTPHLAPGRWEARLERPALPDGAAESELLGEARLAELQAFARWLGLSGARASRRRLGASVEYRLEWPRWRGAWLGLPGALVVAAALAVTSAPLLAVALAALVSGAAAAWLGWDAARRRAARQFERARLACLERALALGEASPRTWLPQAGRLLDGRYLLGERLAQGGGASVFAARCLTTGRDVALKIPYGATQHQATAADRLRREAAALRLAWHEGVVRLLDEGELPGGTPYLVLERLRGVPLDRRLREQGPLSEQELGPLALRLCDALVAVHAAGIVHRDVKPANLFLVPSERGEGRASGAMDVKLLDFGVAQIAWTETQITRGGGLVGTPGYAAPEQAGAAPCDARADVFGLGVTLRECLTGEPPRGQSPDRTARAGAPPPSPAWQALLARAVEPHPEARFQSVSELREALLAACPGLTSLRPPR